MIRKLLYLTGIGIFMVVVNHAIWYPLDAPNFWRDAYIHLYPPGYVAVQPWMKLAAQVIMFITHASVPIFVLTTGLFCAISFSGLALDKVYKPILIRLRGILIPYTIWSLVTTLVIHVAQGDLTLAQFFTDWATARANYTFYYILQLVQLYLLAPFILYFLKRQPLLTLVITFVLQLFMDYQILITTIENSYRIDILLRLFPYLLFYFTLGAFIGLNLRSAQTLIRRFRPLFLLGMAAALLTFTYEASFEVQLFSTYIFPRSAPLSSLVFALCFNFWLLSIENWHPRVAKALVTLGQAVFAIFLTHYIIVFMVNAAVHRIFPVLIGLPVLYFLISTTAALFLPLLGIQIIRRTPLRKYSTYLFG